MTPDPITPARVVIAGAGVGGLTLAVALRRRGVRVRVFERASAPGATGAGLALPANGVKGLATLGLGSAVVKAGAAVERAAILDSRGRQLGSEVDLSGVYRDMGASLVALHRARLHAILVEAAGSEALMTSRQVASFEQNADAVQLALFDGERVEGDLLVGADGLHYRRPDDVRARTGRQRRRLSARAW